MYIPNESNKTPNMFYLYNIDIILSRSPILEDHDLFSELVKNIKTNKHVTNIYYLYKKKVTISGINVQ